jgi:hypothetical protein
MMIAHHDSVQYAQRTVLYISVGKFSCSSARPAVRSEFYAGNKFGTCTLCVPMEVTFMHKIGSTI